MNISFEDYKVDINENGGGFPTSIVQLLRNNRQGIIMHTDNPWLSVKLSDGSTVIPVLDESAHPLYRQDSDGRQYAQFSNVKFCSNGKYMENWRLGLEYEFYPDGNMFSTVTFVVLGNHKPDIISFKIEIPLDFQEDDFTVFGFRRRYSKLDPTGIFSPNVFVRGITEKSDISERETLPLIAFDFGKKNKLSRHFEFFIEDQNTIDEDPKNVRTDIKWSNGNPTLVYEFAVNPIHENVGPYYWRNKIGFTIGQTPKIRDKAPLRLYHYFDETKIFPTDDQIQRMAAEGADVLALHECWRTDMRNGGIAYDANRYSDMVKECHKNGIRVTPYIRGDYESAVDDKCSWFNWELTKNYDGLYIDYGAVDGYFEIGGRYPGGRYDFKRYYDQYLRLRKETIGKDGVMTVHTGPFFSAGVLASTVDGYVAGEGEMGVLLHSRWENQYFNESTIAPGSLWTAAFPAYQTQQALPFMANIGQFPHVTLGAQWVSSCLAHPDEPGCVTFARPLWKLYGLMKDERRIRFDNDVCNDKIVCDSDNTGLASFTMSDGSRLLIMSNFTDKERMCSAKMEMVIHSGQKCHFLKANINGCEISSYDYNGNFEADMESYGICGFLVCEENEKWNERIDIFRRPYPEKSTMDIAYEEKVRNAEKNQEIAIPAEKQYLKIDVPGYYGTLETEFWYDSYNKTHELTAVDCTGHKERIGYVSRLGLTKEEPDITESMYPGESTDWIPLHEYLKKGKYRIVLHSTRGGKDVNIKYHMLVSATRSENDARDITFFSEIDCDRAKLSFNIELV